MSAAIEARCMYLPTSAGEGLALPLAHWAATFV